MYLFSIFGVSTLLLERLELVSQLLGDKMWVIITELNDYGRARGVGAIVRKGLVEAFSSR